MSAFSPRIRGPAVRGSPLIAFLAGFGRLTWVGYQAGDPGINLGPGLCRNLRGVAFGSQTLRRGLIVLRRAGSAAGFLHCLRMFRLLRKTWGMRFASPQKTSGFLPPGRGAPRGVVHNSGPCMGPALFVGSDVAGKYTGGPRCFFLPGWMNAARRDRSKFRLSGGFGLGYRVLSQGAKRIVPPRRLGMIRLAVLVGAGGPSSTMGASGARVDGLGGRKKNRPQLYEGAEVPTPTELPCPTSLTSG
jgi:hypothetical protein